jgi:hypothetical protein
MTCPVCEVLRAQLDESTRERLELLHRVLAPPATPVEPPVTEEMKPITPQHMPWRVRQQMLEQEDHRTAVLMRQRKEEIEKLERELGVSEPSAVGEK